MSIVFLFITILFSSFYLFTNTNGQVKPNVKISLEPNSNVGWKLVHPETQAIPTYGFSESAYI
jgi:hypothetical protein